MQKEGRSYATKLRAVADLAIILIIIPLIVYFAITPLSVLESQPSICVFRSVTGHPCLGCGITKAFAALLQLQPSMAMQYNSKILFVFPAMVYIVFRYYKRRVPELIKLISHQS